MVLAEVLFALIICGIILALSVLIFKSDDISVTPHIFATIRNISGYISLYMIKTSIFVCPCNSLSLLLYNIGFGSAKTNLKTNRLPVVRPLTNHSYK